MPRFLFMTENISGVSPLQFGTSGSIPPSSNSTLVACMEPLALLMCKAVFWDADAVQDGSPPLSKTCRMPRTSFVLAKVCSCEARASDIAAGGWKNGHVLFSECPSTRENRMVHQFQGEKTGLEGDQRSRNGMDACMDHE
mmetsp:Transcript_1070/g.6832  ORF Transcript_1070/g.6832 Transcript_1070/m.6832 type:complete len:140 (+) Transcript_1070:1686-2105(+)